MGNKPSTPTDLITEIDIRPEITNDGFRSSYGATFDLKNTNKSVLQRFSFRTPVASSEKISRWIIQIYDKDELRKTFELNKTFKNTDELSVGGTNINDFFSNNKFVSLSLNFGWYEKILNPEDIKIFIYIEIPDRDPINILSLSGSNIPYYTIDARFKLTNIILK